MEQKYTGAIEVLELAQKALNIEEYYDEAKAIDTAIAILKACV